MQQLKEATKEWTEEKVHCVQYMLIVFSQFWGQSALFLSGPNIILTMPGSEHDGRPMCYWSMSMKSKWNSRQIFLKYIIYIKYWFYFTFKERSMLVLFFEAQHGLRKYHALEAYGPDF